MDDLTQDWSARAYVYCGEQTMLEFMECTIWHAGQHCHNGGRRKAIPPNCGNFILMKKQPRTTTPQFAQAVALLRRGDVAGAEATCLAILRRYPNHFDALHLSGLAAMQAGRHDDGVRRLTQALTIAPKNADLHANLALALMSQGRDEDAVKSFERALALNPHAIDAGHNYGSLILKIGRYADAIIAFDRVIARKADHADAHHQRGRALAELDRLEEAYSAYEKAHLLQPNAPEYLASMAAALCLLKRHAEALPVIQKALEIRPGFELALLCRVDALRGLGQLQDSLAAAEEVIAANPQSLQGIIWGNAILMRLGQTERALQMSPASRNIAPDDPVTYINHGFILAALNRFEEALIFYDRALKLKPDHPEAHHNRAFALLTLGRFEEGWLSYEYRNLRHKTLAARKYTKPLWWGKQPLKDQRLFVYPEQGFGDTIQFARYAMLAADAGARVVLSVQNPLRRVFKDFHPGVTIIGHNEVPTEFDLHCPLLSLPLAFGTRLESIPAWPHGYLKAPAEEVARWAQRLPAGRRRIGLVWSGSTNHTNDANRSLALERLSPLFQPGDAWVSLQKEVRESDQPALQASGLFDLTAELDDFADTAALISALDLVIAVDTSVAHLAAALGKPVWLMVPFSPDFRWLLKREDSPWYPSLRLFRQQRLGDWEGVIARIGAALQP